jgi:hypothetical protein
MEKKENPLDKFRGVDIAQMVRDRFRSGDQAKILADRHEKILKRGTWFNYIWLFLD